MTENQTSIKSTAAIILKGAAWLSYLACVLSTFLYLDSFSGVNGGWAFIIMIILFAPAFIVFLITGGIAQKLDVGFAKTFFAQNLLLVLLGIFGILILFVTTQNNETRSLYGPPDVTHPETLIMIVILLLLPGGLGMGLSKILPNPKG